MKKSLCNVAVKALVDLMADTAAEAAAETRRQTKRCSQRGINCTEAERLPDAHADKPDHTLGDLWAEAVINTVADTQWSTVWPSLIQGMSRPSAIK